MRYLELIAARPLVWGLFAAYLLVTSALAWLGHKKTGDMKSFAVGRGDMHPVIVGVTLAASIASTATFVINPGFVYVHGLSALMHLGVSAGLGVIAALLLLSAPFRRIGAREGAITLPAWIGARYGSRALRIGFAAVNLLSLSFVVLIVGGLSIVMQGMLGLDNTESLVLVIAFVFGYVLIGGTYAHAYTNTLQGILMAAVALVVVASGLPLLSSGWLERLAAQGPELTSLVNPKSDLFGDAFSVWVSGFAVGFALVCQPHILTKALYVKSDRDVRRYLGVTIAVSLVFSALLLVGLYARLAEVPAAALVDPESGGFRQDRVVTAYLAHAFGPGLRAVVAVALLSAGMSTLDGILVALSSIAGHDLVPRRGRNDEERARFAHRTSQWLLVAMGGAAFVIALRPPALLGIFGQIGVYGIAAASAVPVVAGIALPHFGARAAAAAAGTGLVAHLGLYALGIAKNPAVTATLALAASALVAAPALGRAWLRRAPIGVARQGSAGPVR